MMRFCHRFWHFVDDDLLEPFADDLLHLFQPGATRKAPKLSLDQPRGERIRPKRKLIPQVRWMVKKTTGINSKKLRSPWVVRVSCAAKKSENIKYVPPI